jgi:hypothetical protein
MVSQSVSLGVEILISLTVTVLFLCGALSDKMTGLSFLYAAGPRQRYLSFVQVHWDSRPYFTVSDLRLPFSSPPTTRRVTVEVFDPASTRVELASVVLLITPLRGPSRKPFPTVPLLLHAYPSPQERVYRTVA